MKIENNDEIFILSVQVARLGSAIQAGLAAAITAVALLIIALIYLNGVSSQVQPSTISTLYSVAKWGAIISISSAMTSGLLTLAIQRAFPVLNKLEKPLL